MQPKRKSWPHDKTLSLHTFELTRHNCKKQVSLSFKDLLYVNNMLRGLDNISDICGMRKYSCHICNDQHDCQHRTCGLRTCCILSWRPAFWDFINSWFGLCLNEWISSFSLSQFNFSINRSLRKTSHLGLLLHNSKDILKNVIHNKWQCESWLLEV